MWNDFVQINNVYLEYDGAINFGPEHLYVYTVCVEMIKP